MENKKIKPEKLDNGMVRVYLEHVEDFVIIDAFDSYSEEGCNLPKPLCGDYVDPCFEGAEIGWKRYPKTKKILATKGLIVENSSFRQIFNSLADNLDDVVMTTKQIAQFCEKYSWPYSWEVLLFFLLKIRGKYYVMRVEKIHSSVYEYCEYNVRKLELADVWQRTHTDWVVFPYLPLPEK